MTFNPKYGPGAIFSVDPETLHGRRTVENSALLCYAANGGYCAAIGEDQLPWSTVRESETSGVLHLLTNPASTVEDSHENWMADKAKDGWIFGEAKDAEKKTHPCLVPWDELPEAQQKKDVLFQAVARAALDIYGMRFAHFDAERKVEVGNLGHWRCHRDIFNVGMYVITGRADRIVERATGNLALSYGQRVPDHGPRRNARLSDQLHCAMTAKDAADAYGAWAAMKWPEEVATFELAGERTRIHWHVLFALTRTVMGIEGVIAAKRPVAVED